MKRKGTAYGPSAAIPRHSSRIFATNLDQRAIRRKRGESGRECRARSGVLAASPTWTVRRSTGNPLPRPRLYLEAIVKRAALYMRVSARNHGQTTETQAVALREYAAHRGLEIVQEYRDEGVSGSKDSRPALDRLMKDARARKFDVVIVARFDRFARSVSHLLRALEEFSHLGVDFVSLSESIDTSTPMGQMIFTVLGAVAELERNLIKERISMGISRARKQGKALGRPKRIFDRERARMMLETMSLREVARRLGVSRGVVDRLA
jgi:DNA invertase Pin-like site-specific DNA recombinase